LAAARRTQDWVVRGFRQFDAPVSVVATCDRSIHGGDIAPFDCGAATNALVNAAWSRGLGCLINSQGSCRRRWCAIMRASPTTK
jgi:hypothetical protein